MIIKTINYNKSNTDEITMSIYLRDIFNYKNEDVSEVVDTLNLPKHLYTIEDDKFIVDISQIDDNLAEDIISTKKKLKRQIKGE